MWCSQDAIMTTCFNPIVDRLGRAGSWTHLAHATTALPVWRLYPMLIINAKLVLVIFSRLYQISWILIINLYWSAGEGSGGSELIFENKIVFHVGVTIGLRYWLPTCIVSLLVLNFRTRLQQTIIFGKMLSIKGLLLHSLEYILLECVWLGW